MPQFILCFISFHFMPFLFGDAITKPLVGLVKFGTFATLNTLLTIETFMTFMTFVQWWGDLTWPKKPLRCCDIWDTNYNTDNWEPEFMTIFVTWQLIVTLDSIRNSCIPNMIFAWYLIWFHLISFDICMIFASLTQFKISATTFLCLTHSKLTFKNIVKILCLVKNMLYLCSFCYSLPKCARFVIHYFVIL